MRMNKIEPLATARQLLMDFCCSDGHSRKVMHLMRFTPRSDGGRFNESVSYVSWLEFYGRLCERGCE
jgi:hypothetical protein